LRSERRSWSLTAGLIVTRRSEPRSHSTGAQSMERTDMSAAQNSEKTARRGRPFLPRQSGNPGGRPRKTEWSQACRAFLAGKLAGKTGKTRRDALLARLYKEDPKLLLAYAFGKPVEMHLLGGSDGKPFSPAVVGPVVRFILPDNGRS